jgi:hypothetical protein
MRLDPSAAFSAAATFFSHRMRSAILRNRINPLQQTSGGKRLVWYQPQNSRALAIGQEPVGAIGFKFSCSVPEFGSIWILVLRFVIRVCSASGKVGFFRKLGSGGGAGPPDPRRTPTSGSPCVGKGEGRLRTFSSAGVDGQGGRPPAASFFPLASPPGKLRIAKFIRRGEFVSQKPDRGSRFSCSVLWLCP